jgi:hypothetical protein
MKRLFAATIFVLAMTLPVRAQTAASPAPAASEENRNIAPDFSQTSAASAAVLPASHRTFRLGVPDDASSLTRATTTGLPAPTSFPGLAAARSFASLASPASSTTPEEAQGNSHENRYYYGDRTVPLEVALGLAIVRFRSPIYSATAVGWNVAAAYFFNDWFGVEGTVTPAFSFGTVFANEHVKYLGYGGGPKFVRRGGPWEPWGHAIFGGAHILPQTAAGGRSGFGMQLGGGADYVLDVHWALRVEADYLRTSLFGASQNSGQGVLGIVYRF